MGGYSVSRGRQLGYALLGSLSGIWLKTGGNRPGSLRILAYHDVPDGDLFREQMGYLTRVFQPIEGPEASHQTSRPPIWVTFDDGDPSIVDVAMPVLGEFGIKATAFVCPGVIDTRTPYWWHIVEAARGLVVGASPVEAGETHRLKTAPDHERRKRVAAISDALRTRDGRALERRQLTYPELERWIEAGHGVGNHTWDHPTLDTCELDEQRRQIELAHLWFVGKGLPTPTLFAYPNGNTSRGSEPVLSELGYLAALEFDHQLTDTTSGFHVSRLRVNGTDGMAEFRAKVSGLHTELTRMRRPR
jgi:peptidoglycan/xylan/chitin deacetylase (PgdA/CDA1 family)